MSSFDVDYFMYQDDLFDLTIYADYSQSFLFVTLFDNEKLEFMKLSLVDG